MLDFRTGSTGIRGPGRSLTPLAATIAATLTLLAMPALAAQLSDIGDNKLQQATGGTVQAACVKMIPLDAAGELEGDTKQLFERCGELVTTSNELQGDGPTGKSLGISEQELQEALQNVAPEETESIGSSLTDTSQDQLATLASRLQFLRTGTTTLPVAGLHWSGEDWAGGAAGDDQFSRLGAFLSGIYATGDKDETNPLNGVENAYDFDAYGFTAGIDYRFGRALVLGIGLGYLESEVEFDRGYGDTDTEGTSIMGYGTWYSNNLFLEGSLVYGDYDYNMLRQVFYPNNSVDNPSGNDDDIDQDIRSKTEGDSLAWSLGLGYNWNIENANITLSAKARGLEADIDGYSERGGELAMEIDDQDIDSLQSVLEAQFSFNFNRGFGVLVPYGGIAWFHEFEDDPRDISARYVFDPFKTDAENTLVFTTDGGDDDFFRFNLGVNFVLTQGTQVFFNYDTILGLKEVSSHAFTLGARLEL